MRQVFLLFSGNKTSELEYADGLPVSEKLLSELSMRFPQSSSVNHQLDYKLSASAALSFLRDFYTRYELSQPQRRVWLRFEKILSELTPESQVQFVSVEVSEHRSRRYSKKT